MGLIRIVVEYTAICCFVILTVIGVLQKNWNFGVGINLAIVLLYIFLFLQPIK